MDQDRLLHCLCVVSATLQRLALAQEQATRRKKVFSWGHVITILQTTSVDTIDQTKLRFTGDATCKDYKTPSMAQQTRHTQ